MDEDDAVDGTAGRRDGEHSEEGKKNRSREKEREGETGDGCDDDGQWLCIPVKLFSTSPASVTGKPQPFSFDPLFHSSIARVRARAVEFPVPVVRLVFTDLLSHTHASHFPS